MKKSSPTDVAKMDSLKVPQKGGSTTTKPSTGSIPITVRFNAGEESIDDIFQNFHTGGGDSLSSSPHQNVEENPRNANFLQGNFFNNRRSVNPQSSQLSPSAKQLSPNHPCVPENSPFNGSQSHPVLGVGACISPNKYQRSISYSGKGTSPTPIFSMEAAPGAGPLGNGSGGSNNDVYMYQGGNGIDIRPMDSCLNEIMRKMSDSSITDRGRGKAVVGGSSGGSGSSDHITPDEAGSFNDGANLKLNSPARSSPHSQGSAEVTGRYSRKVFVGGLPPDIDEDEITTSFRRFGPLVVDWPHKAESKSYFPPKGYAFLLFQDENSVQQLIESCITDEDKLYLCVSSPTIKDKPVQIRPWRLADADFVLDATMPLDPRKTVFVGGVPRPLKALELAMIMDRLYGGVCYAGIDTDPELKYPKGAGRVAFANQQSYISAISARFVQLQHGDIDKRVEVKPYVLDDQMCDECEGQRCNGKFAPYFCANVTCLQYYCEQCWGAIHSRPGREYHKPLVKEGADRPRAVPFRWC